MQKQRRRQARARRLGQHPGDVVERGDPMEPEMAPAGIDGGVDDPGFSCLFTS